MIPEWNQIKGWIVRTWMGLPLEAFVGGEIIPWGTIGTWMGLPPGAFGGWEMRSSLFDDGIVDTVVVQIAGCKKGHGYNRFRVSKANGTQMKMLRILLTGVKWS